MTSSSTQTNGNPSPGKQPLSQQALTSMFNSTDTAALFASTDLTALFATGDSAMSMGSMGMPPLGQPDSNSSEPTSTASQEHFKSIDAVAGIIAGSNSSYSVGSQSFLAQFMSSKDSLFGSKDMASKDMLLGNSESQLNGLSPTLSPTEDMKRQSPSFVLPGIYESRDWIALYKGDHTDIEDTQQVFKHGEEGKTANKKEVGASNFFCQYMGKGDATTTKAKPAQKKRSLSRCPESKTKKYVTKASIDILCGRGGKSNAWPGNEHYREVVEAAKPRYRTSAKYEKTLLSQEIVEKMLSEGRRFLKQDSNGQWYPISFAAARKKCGQALREENTPESRAIKRERYRKN